MKKVLALVMALALVFSLGVAALAADTTHDTHAEKPTDTTKPLEGGVVGAQGDSADVSTDIYLKIAEDDDGDPEVKVKVVGEGENGLVYVVDYTDKSRTTFSATVPLYVCLYGYGQSGGVATPAATSYQISNSSTYSVNTTIDSIKEYRPVYSSIVELLTERVGVNALLALDTDDAAFIENHKNDDGNSGTKTAGGQSYSEIVALMTSTSPKNTYFYYDDDDTVKAVSSATAVIRVDGREDEHFIDTGKSFTQASGNKATFTIDGVEYKDKQVGNPMGDTVTEGPLALVVSEINATTYGWTLTEESPTKAKELLLTINGTNIAGAVGGTGLALSGSDWLVGKPTIAGSNVTPGTLGLKLTAAIAPNVNEIGEAAVVNVAYTLEGETDSYVLNGLSS